MRKVVLALVGGLVLANSAWGQDSEDDLLRATSQEWTGAGIGGVIGGVAAGPPGIVAGLAFGALFGRHEALEQQVQSQHQQIETADRRVSNATRLTQELTADNAMLDQQLKRQKEIRSNRLRALADGFVINIHFRTESTLVEPVYQKQLRALGKNLRAFPELTVHIDAYADSRGVDAFNQTLSENRFDAVKQMLMDQGIPSTRIVSVGHGERQALYPLQDGEGLGFDRRVQLSFGLGGI